MIISHIKLICSYHLHWWNLKNVSFPVSKKIANLVVSVGIGGWNLGALALNLHLEGLQFFSLYNLTLTES